MTAMTKRRGRIFRKYGAIVELLVGGALVTSGVVQTYFAYQESKDKLGEVQQAKAVTAAVRIEQWLGEVERNIKGSIPKPWLGTDQVCPDQDRRLQYIGLQGRQDQITEVGYIDGQGREQRRRSRRWRTRSCARASSLRGSC